MDQKQVDELFRYAHLPPDLQEASKNFHALATKLINDLPPSAERTLSIRKLWEVKNLAVYAAVAAKDSK